MRIPVINVLISQFNIKNKKVQCQPIKPPYKSTEVKKGTK